MGRGSKPAKGKAKPAVPRKMQKNEDSKVRDLETRLAEALGQLQTRDSELLEALEQQTATSDILKVIASTPTDLTPVFETILRSAVRLFNAYGGSIRRFDGKLVHLAAVTSPNPEADDRLRRIFPHPPDREYAAERPILDGTVAHIPDTEDEPSELTRRLARDFGFRRVLAVPMLREGQIVGVINVTGSEPGSYSAQQIAVLQTFADQAVIAIENVRLFTELQGKNTALTQAHAQVTEALEQQTATSEILRVISGSPTDLQPVFDSIAASALRLCEAKLCTAFRFDGELIHLVGSRHVSEEGAVAYRDAYPSRPGRQSGTHRAILTRTIVHIPDIREDAEYELRALARANDYGCVLSVPMLRDGHPVGAITVGREAARPFSDAQIELLKTFADQAVIAIENVRLFTELQQKNRALTQAHAQVTESLERQTATSEILGVISNAHSDAQPVFDTIVQSAVRLCKATGAAVFLTDGRMLYEPANYGGSPEVLAASRARYPRPLDTDTTAGIAVLTRSVIHVPDTEDPSVTEWMRQSGRLVGFRSVVTVPMLREGDAVGAILVTRRQPGPFSDTEVELLKSFADQAVIAIENVRLFNELQEKNQALTQAHAQVSEALEQQTATSEILRVISQSQTDLHPVFEAIVRSAAQLCEATVAALHRFDGQLVTFEAHHGMTDREIAGSRARFPLPIERGTAVSRAILDARTIHIHEIGRDPEYRVSAWQTSFRTVLAVPLLRDDVPVGAIGLWRREVQPFSEKQIKLVETFADQAVIAIENVRLFTELQEKNRALTAAHAQVTEALDQQTATAEILRVISSSPTDTQPVFEGIARSGVRVCGALGCAVFLIEDDVIRVAATHGVREERLERFRTQFPAAVSAEPEFGKVIREGLFHLADIANNQEATAEQIEYARLAGYRTRLMVPMRRGRDVLGVIAVTREEASPFSDQQVELLKTFADQAVIAIENVRLFKELEARTQDLTRSVGELRALGEVGQAISSTLDLQTVLTTIVGRATHLAGVDAGVIYEYDEQRELFEPRATERLAEDIVRALVATPIRKGEGATGQLAELREPIQVADVRDRAQAFQAREVLVRAGYRAALAVPLVRENRLLGGLTVFRKTPGEFAPEVVDLLRTFATQSALAIQNARLFREIEVKSRQLEVASQHKSEFLANMSHELRTPLNAIIGFSEVLSDRMFGELNEKQEEYLKDIYASGTHLLSLINDILDLSKIEAGRMELELTEFDLPTAIDNALTLIRERAGRRSIALQTDIDGRLGQIQADERKIRQVVLNLLSNAIKFTPEGGRIDVSAEPRDGFVEVSVTDTGIGIAPEDQEKVFEEFRQVGTAAKKIEGTGLGLTLCRKFVELHGGRIWVKSQLGEGSTFTFTIPMRRGE